MEIRNSLRQESARDFLQTLAFFPTFPQTATEFPTYRGFQTFRKK